MLRQRIDQLQGPDPRSGNSHSSAAWEQPPIDHYHGSVSQSQEPPAYTPSPAGYGPSPPRTSSEYTMSDTSSVPSIPQAPAPDPGARALHLIKPVVIPATNAKLGSPFLRAYPRGLEDYNLPPETFIRFIDNLNRVAVANPPLQVLGLAGAVTGMVPLATAQIVGNAVSFAAQVGTVAVSKGRTEVYMRQVNKEIFAPRGLKVEIAKLPAIAKMANIPILDDLGKIDKKSKLLHDVDVGDMCSLSGQERRLTTLSQWIQPLELHSLPTIQEQKNPLSKLSQAASERARNKGEKKLIKEREKIHEESGKVEREYRKETIKQDKKEEKARRKKQGHKLEEKLEEIAKERRKIDKEYVKESGKLVKDDKEEKAFRKLLWLVIRNLEEENGAEPDPYVYEMPEA